MDYTLPFSGRIKIVIATAIGGQPEPGLEATCYNIIITSGWQKDKADYAVIRLRIFRAFFCTS